MLNEIEKHNLAALLLTQDIPLTAATAEDPETGRILSMTFNFTKEAGFDPDKVIENYDMAQENAVKGSRN